MAYAIPVQIYNVRTSDALNVCSHSVTNEFGLIFHAEIPSIKEDNLANLDALIGNNRKNCELAQNFPTLLFQTPF